MFAIIKASGHQFRVEPGAIIAVDGHTGQAGDAAILTQIIHRTANIHMLKSG